MSTGIFPQYFHYAQSGAPQMGSLPESSATEMLQILDACLVKGMCPMTVASATIEGEFIKLVFGVAQPYEKNQFITLQGASPSSLNTKHRIVEATGTSVTIKKGTASSVSGTIKTILSPLGWESIFGFESTTKRAYRSLHPNSSRIILYLDTDYTGYGLNTTNPAKAAKVIPCLDMVELGVPINPLVPEGTGNARLEYHWIQGMFNTLYSQVHSPLATMPWSLIGDELLFYFHPHYQTYTSYNAGGGFYAFGDTPRIHPLETKPCMLVCSEFSRAEASGGSNGSAYFGASAGVFRSSAGRGMFYLYNLAGQQQQDRVALVAPYTGGSFTANPSANVTTGAGPFARINPLYQGLIMAKPLVLRAQGSLYSGALPYVKTILTDIVSNATAYRFRQVDDHFLVGLSTGNTGKDALAEGFIAYDLLEERVEDVVL